MALTAEAEHRAFGAIEAAAELQVRAETPMTAWANWCAVWGKKPLIGYLAERPSGLGAVVNDGCKLRCAETGGQGREKLNK